MWYFAASKKLRLYACGGVPPASKCAERHSTNLPHTYVNAMNHSLPHADRTTHLKILAVALIAAIAVIAVGVFARYSNNEPREVNGPVIKNGKPSKHIDSN